MVEGKEVKTFNVLRLLLEVDVPGVEALLSSRLREALGLQVIVEKICLASAEKAYNPIRGQYNASIILEEIPAAEGYTLLVTGRDLYVPGLNFVFGYAPGWKGVVSTHRLDPEFYGGEGRELFFNRVVKEAVHEVGHMMGLTHCNTPGCVMNFSASIHDVDCKSERLCEQCRRNLIVSRF